MDLVTLGNVGGGLDALPTSGKKPGRKADSQKSSADTEVRASKLAYVRERMRSGYYKSGEVDQAITDKISGAFDRFA